MTGMQEFYRRLVVGLMLVGVVFWVGCMGSTGGPSAAGAKLLLETEPADAGGIIELKSAMITGTAPADGQTVVVGRVVKRSGLGARSSGVLGEGLTGRFRAHTRPWRW